MDEPVKHWMTGRPRAIEPFAPAVEALDAMAEHGIRHLPVVDPQRAVVGVVSIDDLREALPLAARELAHPSEAERERAREVCVSDLMSYAPETLSADAPLAEAARRMAASHIGCLPIVDAEERLAGILTETDVLRALVAELWADRAEAERGRRSDVDTLVDDLRRERAALARSAGALERSAARRIEALDRALERAAEGRFGACESCGNAIPVTRLRAFPGATLCLPCARKLDEGIWG